MKEFYCRFHFSLEHLAKRLSVLLVSIVERMELGSVSQGKRKSVNLGDVAQCAEADSL
jgi:hypothetical protein